MHVNNPGVPELQTNTMDPTGATASGNTTHEDTANRCFNSISSPAAAANDSGNDVESILSLAAAESRCFDRISTVKTALSPVAAVDHVLHVSGLEPRTLMEALKFPDGQLYFEADVEEIKALVENRTWELVPLPAGHKAIGSRWVFRIK